MKQKSLLELTFQRQFESGGGVVAFVCLEMEIIQPAFETFVCVFGHGRVGISTRRLTATTQKSATQLQVFVLC